jgi:hypothetical protein
VEARGNKTNQNNQGHKSKRGIVTEVEGKGKGKEGRRGKKE